MDGERERERERERESPAPISVNILSDPVNPVRPVGSDVTLTYTVELSQAVDVLVTCLLYTSPSPRDATLSRMPSSA